MSRRLKALRGGAARALRGYTTRVRGRDAGSITVIVVFMTLALTAVAGVVYDASGALTQRQRAADIAEQAARYGADQLQPTATGSTPLVNPAAARSAVLRYLRDAGVTGTVQASPTRVTVTVTTTYRTTLLAALGIDTLPEHESATATPLPGLKTAARTQGA
jgi:Flp pilus assembly protein TadG